MSAQAWPEPTKIDKNKEVPDLQCATKDLANQEKQICSGVKKGSRTSTVQMEYNTMKAEWRVCVEKQSEKFACTKLVHYQKYLPFLVKVVAKWSW